jgi:hypothetical protein
MLLATVVAALLAVAPPAVPASPGCLTPQRTGVFRLSTTRADGMPGVPAMLVLENIHGCLEASIVTDAHGPAMIDHLALDGDTLTGSVVLSTQPATVAFRVTDTTVDGSIVAGKERWRVDGRRTT